MTLGLDSQIWIGGELRLVHFDNPLTIQNVAQTSAPTSTVDPAVTAEKRRKEIVVAKLEIKNVLASGLPLTANQLLKADFDGVTEKNISLINNDITKLPEKEKTDIRLIEKVVFKYATVDKIASGRRVYSADLINAGLIPEESKNKAAIIAELKRLPEVAVDSYEEIQEVIALYEKSVSERKSRLAAILARRR